MNATPSVSNPPLLPAVGETSCENDNERTIRFFIDCIAKLPDLPKRILTLHYSEGLRFSEIAEVFGLSESQVSHLHQTHVAQLRASIRQTARKP